LKTFYQKLQRNTLLRGLLTLIIGIYALWNPKQFSQVIIYLVVGIFLIFGVFHLVNWAKDRNRMASASFDLFLGVACLFVAVVIFLLAKPIVTILTVFLGIGVVIAGCLRIGQGLQLKKENQSYIAWLFVGILFVIAGLLLMFRAVSSLVSLFGVIMIVMALTDIFEFIQFKKN